MKRFLDRPALQIRIGSNARSVVKHNGVFGLCGVPVDPRRDKTGGEGQR